MFPRSLFVFLLSLNFSFGSTFQKGLEIHFINVGQGDCTLIRIGCTPRGVSNGSNILIDAGLFFMAPKVKRYLKEQGVRKIDLLMSPTPTRIITAAPNRS